MNIEKIKNFINKDKFVKSEEVLKDRLVSLDTSLTLKRSELSDLIKQFDQLKSQINVKSAEIFADEQRFSELCDLAIEMYPDEEVA
jgi:hypothetical protein